MYPQDLQTKVDSALFAINSWLVEHVVHTSPLQGASSEEILFRRKCFNELCSYLMWVDQLNLSEAGGGSALMQSVVEKFDDRYLEVSGRSPRHALTFSASTAFAIKHQVFPLTTSARLADLLSGPFSWQSELPPFRMLDLLAACAYADLAMPVDYRSVLSISSLMLPPSAILADRDGFYALTHTAMFGRLLQGKAPAFAPDTSVQVEAAIYRTLADQDTDLGLELVATALILHPSPGIGSSVLIERVMAELATTGVVDSACRAPSAAVEGFLTVRPDEHWARSFHLMIVAGITLSYFKHLRITSLPEVSDEMHVEIMQLGNALLHLHRYKLLPAAKLIVDRPTWSAFTIPVLMQIGRFLEHNRNGRGGVGFFEMERRLLALAGFQGNADVDVFGETDLACQKCLQHILSFSDFQ